MIHLYYDTLEKPPCKSVKSDKKWGRFRAHWKKWWKRSRWHQKSPHSDFYSRQIPESLTRRSSATPWTSYILTHDEFGHMFLLTGCSACKQTSIAAAGRGTNSAGCDYTATCHRTPGQQPVRRPFHNQVIFLWPQQQLTCQWKSKPQNNHQCFFPKLMRNSPLILHQSSFCR